MLLRPGRMTTRSDQRPNAFPVGGGQRIQTRSGEALESAGRQLGSERNPPALENLPVRGPPARLNTPPLTHYAGQVPQHPAQRGSPFTQPPLLQADQQLCQVIDQQERREQDERPQRKVLEKEEPAVAHDVVDAAARVSPQLPDRQSFGPLSVEALGGRHR